MEMTKEALLDVCKRHSLYRTPALNDKLFANYHAFSEIANLEAYTGLKALFLEGNALVALTGLPPLAELKCLFVQQNRIRVLPDLSHLPALNTLDISNNELTHLGGLDGCALETLVCSHNLLATLESVEHLAAVPTLQTIDLQNNQLDDPRVLDVFEKVPGLKCLYLKGNPVVSKISNYRKTLVARLPGLTYLDDRPVFEKERALAEAWAAGGIEAEQAAREVAREREAAAHRRNFEFMQNIRAEGFRQRREALGMAPGDTDPALEGMSDSEWEAPEDPPELVEARKKLERHLAAENDENASSDTIPAVHDGQLYEQDHAARQAAEGKLSTGVVGLGKLDLDPSPTAAAAQLNARLTSSAAPERVPPSGAESVVFELD